MQEIGGNGKKEIGRQGEKETEASSSPLLTNFLLQELGQEEKYQSYQSSNTMEDVQTLVREGKLIQAIKLYREKTGVGLAEAKAAVEQMKGY